MNGFTTSNGKVVIWTTTEFVPENWPFNDDGNNWTFFYKKVGDIDPFASILSRTTYREKKEMVAKTLGMNPKKIFIKSKKQHFRDKNKK